MGYEGITPDFQWSETKTALEYDSDRWHLDALSHGRDARRREALGAAGYSVHALTNEQVRDYDHLSAFMDNLAREMGRHRGKASALMLVRRRDAYDRLLGSPL